MKNIKKVLKRRVFFSLEKMVNRSMNSVGIWRAAAWIPGVQNRLE
jgi:hypothetical protein